MRQAERDHLRSVKRQSFIEQAIEIHMKSPAVAFFEENVFTVPITQSEHVSNHGHDRTGPRISQASRKPRIGFRKHLHEPFVEGWREFRDDLLRENMELTRVGARLR